MDLTEKLFDDPVFVELYDHKVALTNALTDQMKTHGLNTDLIDELIDATRAYERYIIIKKVMG